MGSVFCSDGLHGNSTQSSFLSVAGGPGSWFPEENGGISVPLSRDAKIKPPKENPGEEECVEPNDGVFSPSCGEKGTAWGLLPWTGIGSGFGGEFKLFDWIAGELLLLDESGFLFSIFLSFEMPKFYCGEEECFCWRYCPNVASTVARNCCKKEAEMHTAVFWTTSHSWNALILSGSLAASEVDGNGATNDATIPRAVFVSCWPLLNITGPPHIPIGTKWGSVDTKNPSWILAGWIFPSVHIGTNELSDSGVAINWCPTIITVSPALKVPCAFSDNGRTGTLCWRNSSKSDSSSRCSATRSAFSWRAIAETGNSFKGVPFFSLKILPCKSRIPRGSIFLPKLPFLWRNLTNWNVLQDINDEISKDVLHDLAQESGIFYQTTTYVINNGYSFSDRKESEVGVTITEACDSSS